MAFLTKMHLKLQNISVFSTILRILAQIFLFVTIIKGHIHSN